MSFRKRNTPLAGGISGSARDTSSTPGGENPTSAATIQGVRPSHVDGRPTISTGTASLDSLQAGHAGLPLGNSLLIEESGTTDYAGSLLRFYAAEGVVQGHRVHVVGMGEHWGRELPGLVEDVAGKDEARQDKDKMKIAWRYERLGDFTTGTASRGAKIAPVYHLNHRLIILQALVKSKEMSILLHRRSAILLI